MQNRTPARADAAPALPDFQPVARKYRHDGWTPERQRAFIAALADTGSVSRAATMVNMSPEGAYYLRRQAGAESCLSRLVWMDKPPKRAPGKPRSTSASSASATSPLNARSRASSSR